MPKHITFTLDSETASQAATVRTTLEAAHEAGTPVRFTVVGRDSHEVTERVGTVEGFAGTPGLSSDSVTVKTEAGYKTFNVWLIRTIEGA